MLNQVKAQYKEMERRVEANKETNVALTQQKEQLSAENQELSSRLEALLADNKNLKTSLLDSERYKEEYREISEEIAKLKKK